MTATDELRQMLDERGVEYKKRDPMSDLPSADRETRWGRASYREWPSGTTRFGATGTTPEQAIAATLGDTDATAARHGDASCNCSSGERTNTCHNMSKVMDEHGQARFVCSECRAWIDSRMLWNPEYRDGESPWVSGCKLNFCPNCGRKVVRE